MAITGPIPLPMTGMSALRRGMESNQDMISKMLLGRQNQERIEQEKLANAQMNQYRMGNLDVSKQELGLKNQLHPFQMELLKQKVLSEKALEEQRKRNPGGLGGVGQKEEMFFQNLVAKDNPQLGNDPNRIYEASNALREGRDILSDGTKLNPLSPASQSSFDRLTKGTTYSGAVVPILKANQSEAELHTIMEMANKDFEPYATTYKGYSPEQIIDTFKTDDASQKKLGNFIASQAAQYEASQIRNRIAGGEPGISATHELMGKSGQIIKTMFPRLSSTARIQATKRLDEYLTKGLEARKSVGIGASNATSNPYGSKAKVYEEHEMKPSVGDFPSERSVKSNVKKWKIVDGQLVEESQ